MNAPKQNVEALFSEALAFHSPTERANFLDRACGDDRGLRKAVQELLQASESAGAFLLLSTQDESVPKDDENPGGIPQYPAPSENIGQLIGRYKLLEKLGEGGFGAVYMAEQREPVKRRVALKIIKAGMDTHEVVARFEAERQALALMDHPNIAKVFDGGATDNGRPYFVLELVRGIKITEYCEQNHHDLNARLKLFMQVCQAVQHAHQKGVIHRDLKPSNILVTLHDGVPVPKVIDFGIAKATQQELTEKTVFTRFHQFIGTPAYMSPEQAELSGLDIDTRSDIYSLGVLLYELLTGATPFDGQELLKAGLDEMRRTIREVEPIRPSTRLSSLNSSLRKSAVRTPHSAIASDLDWIVMKCLEKDRARRYETANGLAADIHRHMTNEPVIARPPSAAYRLQKAVRRNKVGFVTASAVATALLIGTIVSVWQAARATRAREEAENARRAEASLRVQAQAERERALSSEHLARRTAYNSDMNLAKQALAANNLGRARSLLNRHRPSPAPGTLAGESVDLRNWEWRYLWGQTRADDHQMLSKFEEPATRLSFSPDGRFLALSWEDAQGFQGKLALIDVISRQTILSQAGGVQPTFARTKPLLVYGLTRGQERSEIILWDTGQKREIRRLLLPDRVWALSLMPGDQQLLAVYISDMRGAWDLSLAISAWDLESGEQLWDKQLAASTPSPRFTGHRFAFSPDGTAFATGTLGHDFHVLDTNTGSNRITVKATSEVVTALAFSPDGNMILSGAGYTDSVINIWDARTGANLGILSGHGSYVSDLVFSLDGTQLASASGDQTIRFWDWPSRQPAGLLRGHLDEVYGVAFSPDGRHVASHCRDGSVYLWGSTRNLQHLGYSTLPERLKRSVFTQDSQSILAAEEDNSVALWDVNTLQKGRSVLGSSPGDIHFSGDARWVAQQLPSGQLHVFDVASGIEKTNFALPNPDARPRFTKDGNFLGVAYYNTNQVITEFWSTNPWQKRGSVNTEIRSFRFGILTPSRANTVAILDDKGIFSFYDLANPHIPPRRVAGLLGGVIDLNVSPDGRIAAATFDDAGVVQLWDLHTLQKISVLKGTLLGVSTVAFSHDGKRLAVGSAGQEAIKLWDTELWQEVLTFGGEGSSFLDASFSPDGRLLLAMNYNWIVHVWRAPTWAEIESADAQEGKSSDSTKAPPL